MKREKVLFLLFVLCLYGLVRAQPNANPSMKDRPITVAVPFLRVPGDARSAGMGDMGVASSPDPYAQQWNPAKYAFIDQKSGIGLSYVPYLRKLTDDINVGQLNYFNRLNERSAIAGSFRYFNLGTVSSRQTSTETGLELKPNQFSFDISYALRLSEHFSMGVALRYIRSDLKLQTSFDDASAANSFAADISGYYQSDVMAFGNFDGRWRAGFNFSNIGPKIKYSNLGEESFIPTNLGLGGGFDFILDAQSTIGIYGELNKLLVPTPRDSNGDGLINRRDDYYQKGAISGIFSSFGDAPGGFSEEMKEITYALGVEYDYDRKFSLRTGYFHESPKKGYRQYITLGAGFRYAMATINLSYLFSTSSTAINPLEGGVRFSLAFNLGGRI